MASMEFPALTRSFSGWFFPKQVYLCGSLLEKNRLDTLLSVLGALARGVGRRVWPCWAR